MPYIWEHGYTEIIPAGRFFLMLSSSTCLYMGCDWKSCDFLKFSFPF